MLTIRYCKTSELGGSTSLGSSETVIVMPATKMALARRASNVMAQRTKQNALLVVAEDDARLGFIRTSNLVYAKTESGFFAYTAQDAFAGECWLDQAVNTLERSKAGPLAFNDGRFFGNIAAFGLARRKWLASLYNSFIFYPGYTTHFADTELSVLAISTSNLVFNPAAMLIEVDYEKHLKKNNTMDEALYFQRASKGFDGKIPPFTPERPDVPHQND